MNWKVSDISLYIRHKLSQDKKIKTTINYKQLEKQLKKAKIETHSVYEINKSLHFIGHPPSAMQMSEWQYYLGTCYQRYNSTLVIGTYGEFSTVHMDPH